MNELNRPDDDDERHPKFAGESEPTEAASAPRLPAGEGQPSNAPQPEPTPATEGQGRDANGQNAIEEMAQRITNAAGIDRIEGFSLSAMFSETFKKHSEKEVEEYFTVGTEQTTPSIENVDTSWPRPWVFFRMLVGTFVVYMGFVQGLQTFRNINLLPGLIMVGSFAVPISTLVLFFEINARKNVSLYQVIRLVFLGGVLSLIFSLLLFNFSSSLALRWVGASLAGLVEEPGKLMALLLVVNIPKYHYILNGLLFGAAVGTGFAAFESSGYALQVALSSSSQNAMLDVILIRGVLSPFAHIVWTGMSAAVLWKVKGTRKFHVSMLQDPRFYKVFGIAIVLHMIWNSPLQLPFFGKYIVLGFIAWTVILGLIQDGLKQLKAEQLENRISGLSKLQQ